MYMYLFILQFIIGQKYGPVLLPATITATDFDTLREALKNNGDDVALLEHWYWLDYNAMPNIYILQPVSEILGNLFFFSLEPHIV